MQQDFRDATRAGAIEFHVVRRIPSFTASPYRTLAVESIRLCLEALGRYKLRTVLAVSGIVVGVAAVTAMVSIVEGARREVIAQVEVLGLNNVVLRPRLEDAGDAGAVGRPHISFADADRLKTLVPFAVAWSPVLDRFAVLSGRRRSLGASVLGVEPDFQAMMRLRPARGRLLAWLDLEMDRPVGVLGASLARALFGQADAVGRRVLVEKEPYVVVGVLDWRGSAGVSGASLSPRDLNAALLVPARRGLFLGQATGVTELWTQMADDVPVVEGAAIVGHAMRRLHRGRRDVEAVVPLELLRQRLRAQRTFGIVLGSVAGLALLIGGIGIMNMMLASVLERTSEIGLRRSVGATRRWIMFQFLAESTMMTLTGGVVGIVVGVVAATGITRYAGWATHVSVWAIGLAFVVSCAVGVFFGTYPAHRAARLEPVDAVRYE